MENTYNIPRCVKCGIDATRDLFLEIRTGMFICKKCAKSIGIQVTPGMNFTHPSYWKDGLERAIALMEEHVGR